MSKGLRNRRPWVQSNRSVGKRVSAAGFHEFRRVEAGVQDALRIRDGLAYGPGQSADRNALPLGIGACEEHPKDIRLCAVLAARFVFGGGHGRFGRVPVGMELPLVADREDSHGLALDLLDLGDQSELGDRVPVLAFRNPAGGFHP